MKARGLAIALCAMTALLGPVARADETTAAAVDRAAEIYKRANALYDAGKLEDAEKLYREALQLAKSYDIASNLGAVTFDRGKYRDAAEYLSYALANFPAGGKPAERAGIQNALEQARKHVGALKIQVSQPRARVTVDGKPIGDSPLEPEVFVEPGSVTVAVALDGYEPAKQTIEAKAGEARELTFTLAAKSTPIPPERSKLPAFVAGGVGVASLVAGGVLFGVYESQKADLADKLPRDANGNPLCPKVLPASGSDAHAGCASARASAGEASTLGNAGIWLMGIGGAAVAGSVIYLLWPSPAPTAARAPANRLVPIIASEGGGLLVTGSF